MSNNNDSIFESRPNILFSNPFLFEVFLDRYIAAIYSVSTDAVNVLVDATAYSGPQPMFTLTSEIIDA